MITFHLKEMLDTLNISQNKFSKISNVRLNTINDICRNNTKRIEISTLVNIMIGLNSIAKKKIILEDIMIFNDTK